MSDLRKIERLVDGEWKEVPILEVVKGDVIRAFEPDGTPVVLDKRGDKEAFTARIPKDPVWMFCTDGIFDEE